MEKDSSGNSSTGKMKPCTVIGLDIHTLWCNATCACVPSYFLFGIDHKRWKASRDKENGRKLFLFKDTTKWSNYETKVQCFSGPVAYCIYSGTRAQYCNGYKWRAHGWGWSQTLFDILDWRLCSWSSKQVVEHDKEADWPLKHPDDRLCFGTHVQVVHTNYCF